MLARRPALPAFPRRLSPADAALRAASSPPFSASLAARLLCARDTAPTPQARAVAVLSPASRGCCPRRRPAPCRPLAARYESTAAAVEEAAPAAAPVRPSIPLLSRLRKETQVSMSKARDALIATGNDYPAALRWVEDDAIKSGATKAQRLAARVAGEGVVSLVVTGGDGGWGEKVSIAELCCETDFVSRNDNFRAFAARIATAALVLEGDTFSRIKHVPLDQVLSAPLLPVANADALNSGRSLSVREGVADLVCKFGENLQLRRFAVAGAGALSDPSVMVGTYVHDADRVAFGSTAFVHTGRIAGVVLLRLHASDVSSETRQAVGVLAKKIARQVVGLSPEYLSEDRIGEKPEGLEGSALEEWMAEKVLTRQTLLGGQDNETVGQAIERVARTRGDDGLRIELLDFLRFEAGEGVEKPEVDFAQEIRLAGGV